jgi:uncharacterized protein (TIGR02145 family)
MINISKKAFLGLIITTILINAFIVSNKTKAALSDSLSGRILLQVQENGEAWYLNPQTKKRHFLGRPEDAFLVMREQGLGISNANLAKIPIALDNPRDSINTAKLNFDQNFSKAQAGKILLQVEKNGEAWYVNPLNNKRYFLGRPADAFLVMRTLGLGITNNDLNKISLFQNAQKSQELQKTQPQAQQQTQPESQPTVFRCGDSLSYEGKKYPSTKIGEQCWLAKNLNVGTMIKKEEQQSKDNSIQKYCHDYDEKNCDLYGGLYQWAETVQYNNNVTNNSGTFSEQKIQGICPNGWHIPSNNEWQILENYLATDTCGSKNLDWQCSPAGKRLKSNRTALGPNGEKVGTATNDQPRWMYDANNYGIDDVGFSALSSGMTRGSALSFQPGAGAWFWSSTPFQSAYAWYFTLDAYYSSSYRSYGNIYYKRVNGFSVRCLKD